MLLESFHVTNYRSIQDSGEIDASRITALIGRNESGKSNLLRALHSLNPAEGFKSLSPVKDFPRHRGLEECTAQTAVVASRWALDSSDRSKLTDLLPRASDVTHVQINRGYGEDTRRVILNGLADNQFNEGDIKGKLRKIAPVVKAAGDRLTEPHTSNLNAAADSFERKTVLVDDKIQWAEAAQDAIAKLRKALAAADTELSEKQDLMLTELGDVASSISNDEDALSAAEEWILKEMPVFLYLDEYPELDGHQDIRTFRATSAAQLIQRVTKN